MERIPTNRLFQFRPNQLKFVRQQYNFENPEDMNRAVDVLEDWIKNQKHFLKKDWPRTYLEKAIIASKGSLERTKTKIDNICTFRTEIPEFFGDNITKNNYGLNSVVFAMGPQPTSECYRLCFLKVGPPPYSFNLILECYRCMVLACEYMLANDYNDGVIIVIDYTEANIVEMIKFLNLTYMRQFIETVIKGYGMRLKGFHFLTSSKAIDTLITIFKPFLSSKLAQRIYVHKDISTLYQYVPMDLMPPEYGGKGKSLKDLFEEQMAELTGEEFRNYIEEMNKAKTDETYRETGALNGQHLGIPGSFRTLCVD